MKKFWQKILTLGFLLVISFALSLVPKNSQTPLRLSISPTISPTVSSLSPSENVMVKRVIDGDTIELENGQKVRYIGIDTPELHDPRTPVQCFGQEAYLKNKELVEGKTVKLEKDVSETDKYKRLLRYVYLGDIFVNDYLVREGYAHAATFPPDVKFANDFKLAEEDARINNRGLWLSCKK